MLWGREINREIGPVNNAFTSLGGAESGGAMAMIIGGNLGIMMIEGLIVYIQSLRLHLYEF